MIKRKTYWSRKNNKIIAEGKRNNKTIFLFTLPEVEKVVKSSLFTQEKQDKILEKISRLDYRTEKVSESSPNVRTIKIIGSPEKDDKMSPEEARELTEQGDII